MIQIQSGPPETHTQRLTIQQLLTSLGVSTCAGVEPAVGCVPPDDSPNGFTVGFTGSWQEEEEERLFT